MGEKVPQQGANAEKPVEEGEGEEMENQDAGVATTGSGDRGLDDD